MKLTGGGFSNNRGGPGGMRGRGGRGRGDYGPRNDRGGRGMPMRGENVSEKCFNTFIANHATSHYPGDIQFDPSLVQTIL